MQVPVMGSYDSLLVDIPAWLEDSSAEVMAQLPNIISFAEARCARELQIRQFNASVPGTMAIGGSVYPFPTDMQAMRSFTFTANGEVVTLEKRMREWLTFYWPTSTEVGVPKYYAVDDAANFIVAPTPDSAYPYVQRYRRRLLALGPSNQNNWLTDFAYDALLVCCLQRAASFLLSDRRDNLMASYEADWTTAKNDINAAEARVMRDEERQPTNLAA